MGFPAQSALRLATLLRSEWDRRQTCYTRLVLRDCVVVSVFELDTDVPGRSRLGRVNVVDCDVDVCTIIDGAEINVTSEFDIQLPAGVVDATDSAVGVADLHLHVPGADVAEANVARDVPEVDTNATDDISGSVQEAPEDRRSVGCTVSIIELNAVDLRVCRSNLNLPRRVRLWRRDSHSVHISCEVTNREAAELGGSDLPNLQTEAGYGVGQNCASVIGNRDGNVSVLIDGVEVLERAIHTDWTSPLIDCRVSSLPSDIDAVHFHGKHS